MEAGDPTEIAHLREDEHDEGDDDQRVEHVAHDELR